MVAHIRKYKALILTSLLAAYLAGTFQGLFLEGLHHIAHLAEEFRMEIRHSYYNHVHEDGKVHTHRHVVLEVLDETLADGTQEKTPQEERQKLQKKKNPEHRPTVDPIAFFPVLMHFRPGVKDHPIKQVFPMVPTPPPKGEKRLLSTSAVYCG